MKQMIQAMFLLGAFLAPIFGEVPIFQLLMNITLAISLNPVEYWVRGALQKKNPENCKTE